ncbi:hypothetical protein ABID22_002966 [Pontibacter aydingkolensis]|uniref:Carboxypeptidase regulatory-like domain-containing protein n=1 Tax=Pontibacter aydingkolensis TaxID=1911536 RepID=A0ABS7CV11_9BACT|nr:hypothetical protein [Pontibacter aydingkolensis]MBW7467521.1 hypothetical protein [Pontibacter aydingkolensis]
MHKGYFWSTVIVAYLLLVGCTSDEPTPEVTAGDLVGTVTLFDKFEKELPNKEGVIVEVLIGDNKVSTTTNVKGEFSFRDIAYGKLTVNFKKDNYRGFDSLNYNHQSATDSLNFIKLAELPPAITSLLGPSLHNGQVSIPIITEFNSNEWYLASHWLFFSKSSQVSSTNFKMRNNIGSFGGKTGNAASFSSLLPLQLFRDKGFVSGDRIYLRAYPGNSMFIQYNNTEGGYISHLFPTYGNNSSNIVSFILP